MATVFSRDEAERVARVRYATDTLDMPEIGASEPMSEFHADIEPTETKSPPPEGNGDPII